MICTGTYNNNPTRQCNQNIGNSECELILPREIEFKTGRRDCFPIGDQPYKTTKEERQPNPGT